MKLEVRARTSTNRNATTLKPEQYKWQHRYAQARTVHMATPLRSSQNSTNGNATTLKPEQYKWQRHYAQTPSAYRPRHTFFLPAVSQIRCLVPVAHTTAPHLRQVRQSPLRRACYRGPGKCTATLYMALGREYKQMPILILINKEPHRRLKTKARRLTDFTFASSFTLSTKRRTSMSFRELGSIVCSTTSPASMTFRGTAPTAEYVEVALLLCASADAVGIFCAAFRVAASPT
eukprot:284815327_4